MKTVNQYCKERYGEKLYKLSLNGGFTCPNRDGRCGTGGCIFCSSGGSGDFAPSALLPIADQIEEAKNRVSSKFHGTHYIAYFQAFTNTYADVERLRELYLPLTEREDIAVISIATRPDCLPPEVLAFLSELNQKKDVWVELGLQTIHEKSIQYIRRGYANEEYERTVAALNAIGIHTITHLILGLPGETRQDMLSSVQYVAQHGSQGIKLQLLHVLEGTDLVSDYYAGKFDTLDFETYLSVLSDCLRELPDSMVIHRLTGDGPKKSLIAPLWSADKKRVLNAIKKLLPME